MRRRPRARAGWQPGLRPWWFLLPLLLLIALFILLPVLGTFGTSFHEDTAFRGRSFNGLANYLHALRDAGFWQSLTFTLLFVLVSVPLELILGLGFALLLDRALPWRPLLRVCLLIPWAIPAAISARTWELIYNYQYGLANYILRSLGLIDAPINWLGSDVSAFFCVVIPDVWRTAPFAAIIFLAGLQAIPRQLYAQARVDGAHFLQVFWRITLPLLRPVLIVALLFRTIDALRVFDPIYVITGGGPGGATTSLSLFAYDYFASGDFGYGACISMWLFVIALVLALIYVRAARFAAEAT
ncbi:MAG: ABC transporter permease subunit [Candidatus Eisenbacteria bacterium]|nr:ABC transporter permease subunit [Candidatus Eisenbacteria bacterium]